MIVSVWTPGLIAGVYSIPVVVPGSQPEGSHAELFEVWKMIDDAAQVATVIGAGVLAVVGGSGSTGRSIV